MMDSSVIGKIEKAQRYSQEKERFEFLTFSVIVKGDNGEYLVTYDHGQWHCNSEYFKNHGFDSHTMAVEKLLADMLVTPVPVTG